MCEYNNLGRIGKKFERKLVYSLQFKWVRARNGETVAADLVTVAAFVLASESVRVQLLALSAARKTSIFASFADESTCGA